MASPPIRIQFRTATPADAGLLLPLIRSAYRGDASRAGWTTEADLVADERIDADSLMAKITAADSVVLVVTDEQDKLISCCEVLFQRANPNDEKRGEDIAYFGLFAVDPQRQGGGVGKKVLAYAEEYARTRWQARRMEMTVIAQRDEIIAYYTRRGYAVSGEHRPFPYAGLVNGKALRDDLYFEVLVKDLL
jgi:GNAT superfamily N-acetyltransferase